MLYPPRLTYRAECRCPIGRLRWRAGPVANLVVDQGGTNLGDVYFRAVAQTTAWYIGLKNAGGIVAGDTAAAHGGWTDFTTYTGANRATLTLAAFSSHGSSNNATSPGVFTISANGTVAGTFLVSVQSKTGTTGILYSAVDFLTAQPVNTGDVLTITVNIN